MPEFVTLTLQDPQRHEEPQQWIVRVGDICHVEREGADWGTVWFRDSCPRARDVRVYQSMADLASVLTN